MGAGRGAPRGWFARGEALPWLLVASLGCSRAEAPESPTPRRPSEARPPTASDVARPAGAVEPPTEVPDGSVRFVGRVDATRRAFAWPASGFVVAFEGAGLIVRLHDGLHDDEVRDADVLRVTVDGIGRNVALREGAQTVVIAEGLGAGRHEVSVQKRTEAEAGTVTLLGLAVPGGRVLAPPPPRPLRILAIGDSITAGYGIDGRDARCHYEATTSDALGSYVARAAEALEAELQVVAWSGRGLARNYDPEVEETLPRLFERAIPTDPASRFDSTTFPADIVVLNVGTNDLSPVGARPRRYEPALRRFVDRIRVLYPRALLVVGVGPMLTDDFPPSVRALSTARTAAARVVADLRSRGDTAVVMVEFSGALPEEGYACDFHPSRATHARMAAQLADVIRAHAADRTGAAAEER